MSAVRGKRGRPKAEANVEDEEDDEPCPEGGECDDDDDDGDEDVEHVKLQKRLHRQRAHSNPLAMNDSMWRPLCPAAVPYADFYPKLCGPSAPGKRIEYVDIGCGFGDLVLAIAKADPQTLVLGMEIRNKPCLYVQKRIIAERRRKEPAGGVASSCHNAWAVRTNSMKFLPNFCARGQLRKVFICFPDPHFKKKTHRRRVVSASLAAEYAYCLAEGGRLYTITDVMDVTDWMVQHLTGFPLFKRVDNGELKKDPFVPLLVQTNEGQKVQGNNGNMFIAVFDRVGEPQRPGAPLPRDVAAAAAAEAGYAPQPGGERRGMAW